MKHLSTDTALGILFEFEGVLSKFTLKYCVLLDSM